jgi:hypothetical protein
MQNGGALSVLVREMVLRFPEHDEVDISRGDFVTQVHMHSS